jgi:FkbM family methyltransferase
MSSLMPDTSSSSPLAALLAEAGPAADRRAAALVARELPNGSAKLVLCGAGYFGRLLLQGLRANDVEPLAFADNNRALHGTTVQGLQVDSIESSVRKFPGATFVVTAYNPSALTAQLRGLGVAPASARALCYANPETLLPQHAMTLPSTVIAAKRDVLAGADVWADDESRAEYEHLIRWHLLTEPPPRKAGPPSDTYFPPKIVTLTSDERFVDCGAFDGDSLKDFITRTKGKFGRIDAMEPDPHNIAALETFTTGLPPEQGAKVHIHPVAVGARESTLRFKTGMGPGSSITAEGDYEVRCVPLDRELAGVAPTFIKIDVEGAEPDVIRGGAGLIAAHAPTMAIVLYHRTSDMWTIPLALRTLRPDYKLYLRRYAEDCWETVCYAVRASA